MTDSSCTTIETNYRPSRGSHRISQSTSDEVLPEESSAETSPRQPSEEKSFHEEVDVTSGDEEKQKTEGIKSGILSYVNVIEGKFYVMFFHVFKNLGACDENTNLFILEFVLY